MNLPPPLDDEWPRMEAGIEEHRQLGCIGRLLLAAMAVVAFAIGAGVVTLILRRADRRC